ncbi:UNVERIFIED_CONTAM: Pentatricopeptide repeat-containing protein, chloroplastic [Sesamum radiatum]|uniref:Pentatricopeptide repeat-containing protein, chloroplastic n=1 Tax=Sesamum radiatum TaxID=300843 RepID=A0AAW2KEA2_SESRA
MAAATSHTRRLATFAKPFLAHIRSPLLTRSVHVSAYDKNPEDNINPTVVPDHVIPPQAEEYWAPHPQTGVFGPASDDKSVHANGSGRAESVLEEKAFFRPLEDLDKPPSPLIPVPSHQDRPGLIHHGWEQVGVEEGGDCEMVRRITDVGMYFSHYPFLKFRCRRTKESCRWHGNQRRRKRTTSTSSNDQEIVKKFTYSRASPSVRWPHLKFNETQQVSQHKMLYPEVQDEIVSRSEEGIVNVDVNEDEVEVFDKKFSRNKVKKMNKLALKRAKDWRKRVQFLTDRILELKSEEFVADVLDEKMVQMTPTDFCFVVKWVGQSSWQRALEVYEWLNLRHWYAPNARMLATVLAVLGKSNQEALAVEIFTRAEPAVGNTVQVYNAMMGVYARNGRFSKVQELLDLMRQRGCAPDLVSFNTLINARLKSGPMTPHLGIELLSEVRRSGIRPDIITYNTLISGCSRESNLEEAVKVFHDMEAHKCQPDLWTYNAMISVYGRCGLSREAEQLFKELGSKGFFPDAVTYNSLLYAFAREGNVDKVKEICEEMVEMGFTKDEMTYNTIIYMYGKQGKHDLALQIYGDMKSSGRNPDAVTYTVLIDSLGKANKMTEAANVMSEMLNTGIRPTLRTYSALICGYAKAGQRAEAEEMFDCMLRSGIKPDNLAYSVMLDVHLRSNNTRKAMLLYQEMICDGFVPDRALYEALLRVVGGENNEKFIQRVVEDLEELHGLSLEMICCVLTKGECYDFAAKKLRLAVVQGSSFDQENLLSILTSYSSSGRHHEAIELLKFLQEHASESQRFIAEALVVIHCKACQLDTALDEYYKNSDLHVYSGSCAMYEALIKSCRENEWLAEASQIFSDMKFHGVEPSLDIYQTMALIYCKMDLPETAHHLIVQAEVKGLPLQDTSICTSLVEAYGKLKQLEKAESVVGSLRQRGRMVDRKVWNSLIQAYATSGCYEKARAAFNTMMRDGPSPTVETMNCLLQALIVDGRLNELYVVIQDLQDMGFKISKSSIILMLEAFAQSGNIFEVKKIYHGMKAAGYLPTMHLYRVMIGLLSRAKQDCRPEEAVLLMHEMRRLGLNPHLDIYKSLIAAFCKKLMVEQAEELFDGLKSEGQKPDRSFYHLMMKMYRSSGHPVEAEKVLNNLKSTCPNLSTLPYSTVIDAYLKNGDLDVGIRKLMEMRKEGLDPDHRIWTCFIRAASLATAFNRKFCVIAVRDRLLSEELEPVEDHAAFNFVNALEDMLWAFERRATATCISNWQLRETFIIRIFFRKLSAGAALVGLTLWLDHMQDASLEGFPESPKSVVLITGTAEYNKVCLNSTLKAFLWEMGSPFLPCKTRSGILVAKAHSLRMWLKDSPFCLDLELKDSPILPETNSMQLIEGCYMRRGLVPAFNDIRDRLGQVTPRKFARLALLSDEKRDRVIRADIEGRREKLAKLEKTGVMRKKHQQLVQAKVQLKAD